jgi:glycosyltransferase 2 family protein
MKIPTRGQFSFLVKLVVTGALLGYLASRLNWRDLATHLATVDGVYFAAAFVLIAAPIVLTTLRWQLLLRAQRINLPFRSAVSYDMVALFFNAFLPGSTGGDAARVVYAISRFPSEKTRIIASIFVDRGIGLLVLLSFGYLALALQPDILGSVGFLRPLTLYLPPFLVACFAIGAALFLMPSAGLPIRWRAALVKRSGDGIPGMLVAYLREQRKRPLALVAAFAISAVSYLANFLSCYLLALAIGLPITYTQVILIIAVLYTAISVPISISGHGVREVVLVGLFTAMAIGTVEAAIAYSVLLYLVQLLWSLVGGCWFLIRQRWQSAPLAEDALPEGRTT